MTTAPGAAVVLRPPLDVMRPRPVDEIPRQGGVPGGFQYSLKLDGFRALAFVLDDGRVVLQSRARRDLAPEFPAIAAYLGERLPPGIVLDGELCAYREGRLSFTDLLRTHRERERAGVPVSYIAFDLLALPGHDLRGRPLRERWELLGTALATAGPPLQRVLATDDEATAREWFGALRGTGVEGIVAKSWNSAYRPGRTWAWRKIRHADTQDALLVGVFGPPGRPHAALVRLPDGRTLRTTPRLGGPQAHELAELTAGRLGPPERDPDHGTVRPLPRPLPVELRLISGRQDTARFVRVRDTPAPTPSPAHPPVPPPDENPAGHPAEHPGNTPGNHAAKPPDEHPRRAPSSSNRPPHRPRTEGAG